MTVVQTVESEEDRKRLGLLDEPETHVVKHGVFWYHEPDRQVVNGEEKVVLVERLAFYGQPVSVHRHADLERADKHGAFFSEEELKQLQGQQAALAAGGTEGRDISQLSDSELVDWLMSTGEFDGQKKPTADEVVGAANNDPQQAGRLLDAEEKAQGDSGTRATVESGLQKIIDQNS